MNILCRILALASLPLLALAGGCHHAPDYPDDPQGNFECLWRTVDEHYCFFAEKEVDWNEVGARYRAKVTPATNYATLFAICSAMLDELRDGHVNLSSPFNTSYYRQWWTDYPQDFSLRTLQQYYLDFNWLQTNGITYKMLADDIGYIRIPSFSNQIGEGNLDYILAILSQSRGLIIDIRDNGGGLLTNIDKLVGRFITEEFTCGYIQHKTGPGHADFSRPYPMTCNPSDPTRISYHGPIALLTNRSCYSAANNFASVMRQLPQAVLIGARTGGGGGLPFSSELPNGWSVRFSACPVTDAEGRSIESGVDPTPGFETTATEEELAAGRDAILDRALEYLSAFPKPGE